VATKRKNQRFEHGRVADRRRKGKPGKISGTELRLENLTYLPSRKEKTPEETSGVRNEARLFVSLPAENSVASQTAWRSLFLPAASLLVRTSFLARIALLARITLLASSALLARIGFLAHSALLARIGFLARCALLAGVLAAADLGTPGESAEQTAVGDRTAFLHRAALLARIAFLDRAGLLARIALLDGIAFLHGGLLHRTILLDGIGLLRHTTLLESAATEEVKSVSAGDRRSQADAQDNRQNDTELHLCNS
jgi:hypothetical protein